MDIRVSGHQIDTGSALRDYVTDRLNGMVEKYFNRAHSANVTFGKAAGGAFSSDIITHVSKGLILKAHAEAHDVHQSFDQAAGKMEKQLRRYKRRVQDHHAQSTPAEIGEQADYTIFAGSQVEEETEQDDAPAVVAETTADIPEASVADAVMMLDLRDTGALFFKNAASGRHNMVYRRRDGTIGWVEPR
ncbi:ribosomal subunit interface protein [Erythrobacter sp. QSSC1-22B]|uniref:ribosome hibernation-promoting factor, HPF/YfiA family n=1 Tax=Erythrobacter sp. QSSC1-22B TaxID=1860125 RepID=UPI000804B8CC|nr:ribosome-associated translation inhibitor RaiA [Erythrobacter sp. QSSC1-22B]OBX20007.1 ribosomal subunit interface protein [Erythrobacter sp. QSSC1-22B]